MLQYSAEKQREKGSILAILLIRILKGFFPHQFKHSKNVIAYAEEKIFTI
jgi:hypothetical protein